jgi:hypothetical protein
MKHEKRMTGITTGVTRGIAGATGEERFGKILHHPACMPPIELMKETYGGMPSRHDPSVSYVKSLMHEQCLLKCCRVRALSVWLHTRSSAVRDIDPDALPSRT